MVGIIPWRVAWVGRLPRGSIIWGEALLSGYQIFIPVNKQILYEVLFCCRWTLLLNIMMIKQLWLKGFLIPQLGSCIKNVTVISHCIRAAIYQERMYKANRNNCARNAECINFFQILLLVSITMPGHILKLVYTSYSWK